MLLWTLVICFLVVSYSESVIRKLLGHNNFSVDSHILHHDHSISDVELFYQIAASLHPTSDKITGPGAIEGSHYYSEMYGSFMFPYIRKMHHLKKSIRFLEIGLGCNMAYGPGASIRIWQKIFSPTDEIWEAEYDKDCVVKARSEGNLEGIHTITGDQGNKEVLAGWVKEINGNLDLVIDDGGHQMHQIMHSFHALWPLVKPGGFYFVEDMQICWGPLHSFYVGEKVDGVHINALEIFKGWLEYLVTGNVRPEPGIAPIPKGIKWILCQFEACVIAKCDEGTSHSTKCT